MSTEPVKNQAGSKFDQNLARIAVGAYDDAQQVRTAMMNRVRDIVRKKNEDIPFDQVEDEKDDEDRSFEKKYQDDNLPDLIDAMHQEGKLSDDEFRYLEKMLQAGTAAEEVEEQYKDVMAITTTEPIFRRWLQNVKGVSTTLTARLLHRFGYCEDYARVSHLWSYSGLAPNQKREKGEQLNYDPQAKTLAWLVADRIIMQGDRSMYKTNFYDPYKEEQNLRRERKEDGACIKCGDNPILEEGSVEVDVLPGQCALVHLTETADEGDPMVRTDDGKVVIITDGDAELGEEVPVKVTADLDQYAIARVLSDTEVEQERGDGGFPDELVPRTETVDVEGDVCGQCYVRLVRRGEPVPTAPESKGHAHNRAVRYLAKKFLKHYWAIARDLQGLYVPDEYIVAYGGHEKREDTFENPFYAKRELAARRD